MMVLGIWYFLGPRPSCALHSLGPLLFTFIPRNLGTLTLSEDLRSAGDECPPVWGQKGRGSWIAVGDTWQCAMHCS